VRDHRGPIGQAGWAGGRCGRRGRPACSGRPRVLRGVLGAPESAAGGAGRRPNRQDCSSARQIARSRVIFRRKRRPAGPPGASASPTSSSLHDGPADTLTAKATDPDWPARETWNGTIDHGIGSGADARLPHLLAAGVPAPAGTARPDRTDTASAVGTRLPTRGTRNCHRSVSPLLVPTDRSGPRCGRDRPVQRADPRSGQTGTAHLHPERLAPRDAHGRGPAPGAPDARPAPSLSHRGESGTFAPAIMLAGPRPLRALPPGGDDHADLWRRSDRACPGLAGVGQLPQARLPPLGPVPVRGDRRRPGGTVGAHGQAGLALSRRAPPQAAGRTGRVLGPGPYHSDPPAAGGARPVPGEEPEGERRIPWPQEALPRGARHERAQPGPLDTE
jgi:hypothetical protein